MARIDPEDETRLLDHIKFLRACDWSKRTGIRDHVVLIMKSLAVSGCYVSYEAVRSAYFKVCLEETFDDNAELMHRLAGHDREG